MPNRASNNATGQQTNLGAGRPQPLGVFGGESAGFASSVIDAVANTFYSQRKQADALSVAKGMESPIPKSIFSNYALFNFRGIYGGLVGDEPFEYYRDVPNNPLMGGYDAHNVSISKIIEFFEEYYPKIGYKPQDFLYHKFYRKIPVNHLVTLRRFPMPVNDNIFDLTAKYTKKPDDKADEEAEKTVVYEEEDITQVMGATAVTYLGETAGNKLDDILKFTYGLSWKEAKAEMETIESGSYTQQPFYNKIGSIGRATADAFKGVSSGAKFRAGAQESTGDRLGTTYENFVIGPVNVIDHTFIRDRGLKFENDIKLTFDYELKSLNYVNPKIAMIDIISNMLTMTTNNAQFFGGGHRYYGAGGYVASTFGDMGKLRSGEFAGYMGSVVRDVETGFKNVFGGPNGNFDIKSGAKGLLTVGKTVLGNMLGGLLGGNFGAIGGTQATKAFISAEPTGNWHITVGNPLNPIVMMGNMYCDSTIMTLGQGLGYDDFPMEVKFEIDLKHGKPRDKGDIENMFNAGRGRIYAYEPGKKDFTDSVPYGTILAGKPNLQNSQSGAQPSDINNNNINNLRPLKSNPINSIFTSNDSQYVSNVVAMMIES